MAHIMPSEIARTHLTLTSGNQLRITKLQIYDTKSYHFNNNSLAPTNYASNDHSRNKFGYVAYANFDLSKELVQS